MSGILCQDSIKVNLPKIRCSNSLDISPLIYSVIMNPFNLNFMFFHVTGCAYIIFPFLKVFVCVCACVHMCSQLLVSGPPQHCFCLCGLYTEETLHKSHSDLHSKYSIAIDSVHSVFKWSVICLLLHMCIVCFVQNVL